MQGCLHVANRCQIGRDVQNKNHCQIDENQLGLPRGHQLKDKYQTRRICHSDTQNLIQRNHRLENELQCQGGHRDDNIHETENDNRIEYQCQMNENQFEVPRSHQSEN